MMIRSVSSLGLVAALFAVSPTAGDGGASNEGPPFSQVSDSVAYLTGTYRITTADAMRRMRLAVDKDALTGRLAGALPEEYAGDWMDQRHGGVLVVASTRPDHTRQVVRGLPHGDEMRVVSAAYSLAELTRIQGRAGTRTGTYAQVDVVRNRVDLWTDRRARVTRAVRALGTDGRPVEVRTEPRETPTDCSVYECDPPIRAGISIGIADKDGRRLDFCSSAFNIKDDKGNLYTSTAGHCFTDKKGAETITSPKDESIVADRRWAGSVVKNETNPRLDFAFVRVEDTRKWFPDGQPRNADYFKCSEEHQPKTCDRDLENPLYRITDIRPYASMSEGDIVCMSGASIQMAKVKPGTRCGEITALENGGIRTNICAKPGDSGSPLLDQPTHKAYGIENSINSGGEGKCGAAEDQRTNYTPLSSALAAAHSSDHTYKLIKK